MSETDSNAGDQPTQATPVSFPETPDVTDVTRLVGTTPHAYDHQRIQDFIDMVFHTPLAADQNRLVYTSRLNVPGMPNEYRDLRGKLKHGRARALYFNTSTCCPDDQGELRHKKALFRAMHVLVLDDIGTKIPVDKVPADLTPTYIIESSKGNYQYGYVLNEPIQNIDHATALCQTASVAGLTDGGGVMATKIVRLPDGVNGKPGPKQSFQVKLVDDSGPYWTPALLVERLRASVDGSPVTWQGILAGDSPLAKKYHNRKSVHAQSAEGVIDPVLEWLYENDMVLGDGGGDWVDIECPWHHKHTSGNNSAGYAPVGRGEMTNVRGFKCFHDHCKDRTIVDFVHWIMANSDFPHLGVEEAGLNGTEFAYDPVNNKIWHIDSGRPWSPEGFKTMFNQVQWVYARGKDKPVRMTAAACWLESPYRMVVMGARDAPGSPRLLERDGEMWINTYRPPTWSSGAYNMMHVQPFLDYLAYLVPDKDERDYFIMWLAAKAQNPRFRGTGILMATQAFGTGRGTLATMLRQIWQDNTATIEFDTMVKAEGYNGWETAQFVIVNETRETAARSEAKGAHRAYETLKQRCDTSVTQARINDKWAPIVLADVCSSYLLFTNHLNAVAIPADDRRLTVLANPDLPAPAQFFTDVHAWLDVGDNLDGSLGEQDLWCWHVWNWLREQPVNLSVLSLPYHTGNKALMVEAGTPLVEGCVHHLARFMVDNDLTGITTVASQNIIDRAVQRLDNNYMPAKRYVQSCINDVLTPLQFQVRITSGPTRIRVMPAVCRKVPGVPTPMRGKSAGEFALSAKKRFADDCDQWDADMQQAALDYIIGESA